LTSTIEFTISEWSQRGTTDRRLDKIEEEMTIETETSG